jgi:hypothetical protein
LSIFHLRDAAPIYTLLIKDQGLTPFPEVNVGDSFVLTFTGSLNDGTSIEGQDCIVIVKKEKKD